MGLGGARSLVSGDR